MKNNFVILMLMTTLSVSAQTGKATTIKKTFSRETLIREKVESPPSVIWALLTNASDFSRWNSTIVSIQGDIQVKSKIKLKSTLDTNRTFKLKIKEAIPNRKLVWGDAIGKRTYLLEQKGNETLFTMHEKIGGLMFPLFANKIPSFDRSFEQFTADLKKEAEIISKTE